MIIRWRKRFLVFSLCGVFLLLSTGALALFGVGDSGDAVLAAILAEARLHSQTLESLFEGMSFLDRHIADMRRSVDDQVDLTTPGLLERDEALQEKFGSPAQDLSPMSQPSYQSFVTLIGRLWGKLPANQLGELFELKDRNAVLALSQTPYIHQESKGFAELGETLVDDLEDASEGKATVRNAQAAAVQVRQLAQIEANQATQLSLQAQQVLNDNEQQKAQQQALTDYLDMLGKGFQELKEQRVRQ